MLIQIIFKSYHRLVKMLKKTCALIIHLVVTTSLNEAAKRDPDHEQKVREISELKFRLEALREIINSEYCSNTAIIIYHSIYIFLQMIKISIIVKVTFWLYARVNYKTYHALYDLRAEQNFCKHNFFVFSNIPLFPSLPHSCFQYLTKYSSQTTYSRSSLRDDCL